MEDEKGERSRHSQARAPVKIEENLAGVVIGLLALITFANVLVRYLTHFSFAFTEEISIFLMVVMTLLGSASLMAKSGHLSITCFVDRLSSKPRRAARMTAAALTGLTFLLLTILGGRMAWDEYRFEVSSPGLGIPTWIYTVWLPLLSLAVVLRAVGVVMRIGKGEE